MINDQPLVETESDWHKRVDEMEDAALLAYLIGKHPEWFRVEVVAEVRRSIEKASGK